MRAHVIFDLDHTLLDTTAFKEALLSAVTACGPSRGEYEDAYRQVVRRDGKVYDYDPDAHIALMHDSFADDAARTAARRGIDAVLRRTAEFLFPGVPELLRDLRRRGVRLTLLTLGNREWQQMKVRHSGVDDLFDEVITTDGDKVGLMRRLGSKGQPTIIVNDNGAEMEAMMEDAPGLTYFLMRGPKGAPEGGAFREVSTIRELALALAETLDRTADGRERGTPRQDG